MSAVGPGQLRARARPLLIASIAGLRAAFALCLAWPLASLVASSGIGARSQGDRALFEDGGYLLLEVARQKGPTLLAAAQGLLPLLGLGLVAGTLFNAALLVGLNQSERLRVPALIERSVSALPRLVMLGAATGLLQLLVVLAASILVEAVPQPLARPVLGSAGQGAIWLAAGAVLGALGGSADVARAASVRHALPLGDAVRAAVQLLLRRPFLSCFGWLPYAALVAVAAALASALAEVLDVSRPGAWRPLLVFAAHQLVVLTAVAARAGWYARALRLSATHGG